jgi:hypothetical protein
MIFEENVDSQVLFVIHKTILVVQPFRNYCRFKNQPYCSYYITVTVSENIVFN